MKKELRRKILELGDLEVLELTEIVSGHSLKHVAAAVASYYVIRWLKAVTIATTKKIPRVMTCNILLFM